MKQKILEQEEKMSVGYSTKIVREKLLKVMQNHIGHSNAISMKDLYKKIYGHSKDSVSELQSYMFWQIVKRAMNHCRKNTSCFIISARLNSKYKDLDSSYFYWVAKDMEDYHLYKDFTDKKIKSMKNLVKRCKVAVKAEWYKDHSNW